jgi:CheY-like chemotaxis protein
MFEHHPTSQSTAAVPADGSGIGTMKPQVQRTILVCEDDEGIRELLVEALQGEGFVVDVARNGREALALLRRGNTHYLLLLDLMMPDINGYEILEYMNDDPELRSEHIILVISATGFVRPISQGILEKRLIKGFLKKPFELDELLALVQHWA